MLYIYFSRALQAFAISLCFICAGILLPIYYFLGSGREFVISLCFHFRSASYVLESCCQSTIFLGSCRGLVLYNTLGEIMQHYNEIMVYIWYLIVRSNVLFKKAIMLLGGSFKIIIHVMLMTSGTLLTRAILLRIMARYFIPVCIYVLICKNMHIMRGN